MDVVRKTPVEAKSSASYLHMKSKKILMLGPVAPTRRFNSPGRRKTNDEWRPCMSTHAV
jgi:hypothetical protein